MSVEIIAVPKAGLGPMWVILDTEIKGIVGPLSFEWSFGDGSSSTEMKPGSRLFEFGTYCVVLEVTDGGGKKHTASITIDASSPG